MGILEITKATGGNPMRNRSEFRQQMSLIGYLENR